MGIEPDAPTVVIGIGGAGHSIINRLSKMLEGEDYNRDKFMFMAVDSREVDDIEEVERWDEYTATLSWTDRSDWNDKQAEYFYLDEDDTAPSESGGVQRNRTAGRALIDDARNFNKVRNNIANKIETFAKTEDGIDVWLVNALGGGTGSGTMPMILGLIQTLEAVEDVKIKMYALSTLPQLSLDPDAEYNPNIDSDAAPNAFAGLAEMKNVIDKNASNDSQPEIDIQLDTEQINVFQEDHGYIRLKHDSIEDYFLLGIDEDKISEDSGGYTQNIETIAALTIFATAVVEENFPGDDISELRSRILRSVDGAECAFPYRDAASFVRHELDIRRINNDLQTLNDLEELYENNMELVQEAVGIQQSSDADHEALTNAISYCNSIINENKLEQYKVLTGDKEKIVRDAIDVLDINEEELGTLRHEFENIEEFREKIVHKEYRPGSPGEFLSGETDDSRSVSPAEYIIEYLYFLQVKQQAEIKKRQARDRFATIVSEIYEHKEVRKKLSEAAKDDYELQDTWLDKWDELEDLVWERIDSLRNALDIYPHKDLDALADELAEMESDAEEKKETLVEWKALEEEINEIVANRRGMLRTLSDKYGRWIDQIETNHELLEDSKEEKMTLKDKKRQNLQKSDRGERFRNIPLQNPNKLISGYFQEDAGLTETFDSLKDKYNFADADNTDNEVILQHLKKEVRIEDLVNRNIVDKSDLYDEITEAIKLLDKRVVESESFSNTSLLPISHKDENWLEATGSDSYTDWLSATNKSATEISEATDETSGGRRGVLQFLFANADVTLDDASEYKTMKAWYKSGRLLDVLNSDKNDPEEEVNWAYPELTDLVKIDDRPRRKDDHKAGADEKN